MQHGTVGVMKVGKLYHVLLILQIKITSVKSSLEPCSCMVILFRLFYQPM